LSPALQPRDSASRRIRDPMVRVVRGTKTALQRSIRNDGKPATAHQTSLRELDDPRPERGFQCGNTEFRACRTMSNRHLFLAILTEAPETPGAAVMRWNSHAFCRRSGGVL